VEPKQRIVSARICARMCVSPSARNSRPCRSGRTGSTAPARWHSTKRLISICQMPVGGGRTHRCFVRNLAVRAGDINVAPACTKLSTTQPVCGKGTPGPGPSLPRAGSTRRTSCRIRTPLTHAGTACSSLRKAVKQKMTGSHERCCKHGPEFDVIRCRMVVHRSIELAVITLQDTKH